MIRQMPNQAWSCPMSIAHPPISASFNELHLLFVGGGEKDFDYIAGLLTRESDGHVHTDHTRNLEETLTRLRTIKYDLLLCDYQPGDGALQLLHEVRRRRGLPMVFISDHINQAVVERAVGTATPGKNANHTRAICDAIETYCKDRQRQKTEQMLRKLHLAVEQTVEMIVITDPQGVMEYVNPSFESVTGYSREEVIGKRFSMLRSDQQGFELTPNAWELAFSGEPFRGVVLNRKKDGEMLIVEKTVTPVRDVEGKITNFVACAHDITQRRSLEAQLQQAQKMDAIGRLAGGVAHDFNNLLMVIGAYAELTEDALSPEHPLRHNVHEILNAARRAADLTRQLLAFGRKQVQSLELLDLNRIISEINRMLPRLIGEDIELEFLPGTELGMARVDHVQIEQVLMNLAANARDAMSQGGRLTIATSATSAEDAYRDHLRVLPPGDYVLLAVTDSGEGIAPEHISHIFEPFYTTKEQGKGIGLGLATVYGIVKQSGGYLWVDSKPNEGTSFQIYLPRFAAEAGVAPTIQEEEQPMHGQETVLLVEDETDVRVPTGQFLALQGYVVLEAASGEKAMQISNEFRGPIHLMISDVVMPQMSGRSLADKLFIDRPQMKVLFVSGYAEKIGAHLNGHAAVSQFLQKPFSLRVLSKKVHTLLHQEPVAVKAMAAAN
jgi:two-component system, cell cycle sensor histidine kinase and response regulator CckA